MKRKIMTKKQWSKFQQEMIDHLRKDIKEYQDGIKRDNEIIGKLK